MSHKNDLKCRHVYQVPLLGIVNFFTGNSEWNERYTVGKSSQSYVNSRITCIARYGLEELQYRADFGCIGKKKSW